jgi:ABC-type uncharacterized transport system auxiliary subunit
MKKYLMVFLIGLLVSGCVGKPQSPVVVRQYTLEYPSPRFEKMAPIETAIRVERFTAVRAVHGKEMVYRPRPYLREVYNHHRWEIRPIDMVTERLLRDMRHAGIFKTIFSYEEAGEGRFILRGYVEEFMEVDEGERSWASLMVHVTLSDTFEKNQPNPRILQKTYKYEEYFKEKEPQELAKAMSVAMEKFSQELIGDLYRFAGGSI